MGKQILYRVGQAGKDLGLSSYRIRRLCETGLIDADFSGKQWQIPAAEIERLKRYGVPSAPKIVDDSEDAEPTRTPNAKAATAILADPSPEMIAAAEEADMSGQQLTVAKNKSDFVEAAHRFCPECLETVGQALSRSSVARHQRCDTTKRS